MGPPDTSSVKMKFSGVHKELPLRADQKQHTLPQPVGLGGLFALPQSPTRKQPPPPVMSSSAFASKNSSFLVSSKPPRRSTRGSNKARKSTQTPSRNGRKFSQSPSSRRSSVLLGTKPVNSSNGSSDSNATNKKKSNNGKTKTSNNNNNYKNPSTSNNNVKTNKDNKPSNSSSKDLSSIPPMSLQDIIVGRRRPSNDDSDENPSRKRPKLSHATPHHVKNKHQRREGTTTTKNKPSSLASLQTKTTTTPDSPSSIVPRRYFPRPRGRAKPNHTWNSATGQWSPISESEPDKNRRPPPKHGPLVQRKSTTPVQEGHPSGAKVEETQRDNEDLPRKLSEQVKTTPKTRDAKSSTSAQPPKETETSDSLVSKNDAATAETPALSIRATTTQKSPRYRACGACVGCVARFNCGTCYHCRLLSERFAAPYLVCMHRICSAPLRRRTDEALLPDHLSPRLFTVERHLRPDPPESLYKGGSHGERSSVETIAQPDPPPSPYPDSLRSVCGDSIAQDDDLSDE